METQVVVIDLVIDTTKANHENIEELRVRLTKRGWVRVNVGWNPDGTGSFSGEIELAPYIGWEELNTPGRLTIVNNCIENAVLAVSFTENVKACSVRAKYQHGGFWKCVCWEVAHV